jgi:hypothetical protein
LKSIQILARDFFFGEREITLFQHAPKFVQTVRNPVISYRLQKFANKKE